MRFLSSPHYRVLEQRESNCSMINNYIKIATRNLVRHKAYTAINVLDLAIGMACCSVIFLYLQYEFSYDRHHENADRIYRAIRKQANPQGGWVYLPAICVFLVEWGNFVQRPVAPEGAVHRERNQCFYNQSTHYPWPFLSSVASREPHGKRSHSLGRLGCFSYST